MEVVVPRETQTRIAVVGTSRSTDFLALEPHEIHYSFAVAFPAKRAGFES